MAGTRELEAGRVIDLSSEVIGLRHDDRRAALVMSDPGSPPHHIDGVNIGVSMVSTEWAPPHRGEMHPDGDEVLYLVSGEISVRLELPEGERTVDLHGGQGLVVPQGVWHLITTVEAGQLVHITPGPNHDHRPLVDASG